VYFSCRSDVYLLSVYFIVVDEDQCHFCPRNLTANDWSVVAAMAGNHESLQTWLYYLPLVDSLADFHFHFHHLGTDLVVVSYFHLVYHLATLDVYNGKPTD